MTLKRRLYAELIVTITPLIVVMSLVAFVGQHRPEDLSRAVDLYNLSLDASARDKSFMNGIADALDTGTIGERSVQALKDARSSLGAVARMAPTEDAAELTAAMDAVLVTLNKDRSVPAALKLKDQLRDIDKALHARADRARVTLIEMVTESQASARRKNELILTLTVVTLLVVTWMARRLVNGVTQPLTRAVDVARHVAQGDLTQQIAMQSRGDETGQLMRALHDMQEGLARIVADVRRGTGSIDGAAREIANGNRDLSIRTERQAVAIQQTTASMEQLSGTVKQNAEHARLADQMVQDAQSVARKGGALVGEVVRTMTTIHSSSYKIAEITSVIDSIALQTNILALNAAVEAARAGVHGRGFAVVAAEVRALAQRSAEAAKEIRDLVTDSVEKVSAGNRLVESAGKTMSDLVTSVQRASDLMAGISSASAQQSVAIQDASQALGSMQDGVQQNAAMVEQATAASEGLRRQAGDLNQLVNAFKLREMQQAPGFSVAVARAPGSSAAARGPLP